MRRHRLEACTKTDAITEYGLQTDYDRGETFRSPAAAVTVDDLTRDYLAHLEARVGHRDPRLRRSARTVALDRQRLEQHICKEFGQRPADSLTVTDVRRLIDILGRKKLAPSTVTSTVNILSGLLRFGTKAGIVERNPVRDLDRDDRPGSARVTEPRYLDVNEVELLLSKLSDTFRPLAAACAFAGLRVSEALGLRWRDIDFKTRTLVVAGQLAPDGTLVAPKSSASAATVPLLPRLTKELRTRRKRLADRNPQLVAPDAPYSSQPVASRNHAATHCEPSIAQATKPN